MNVDTMRKVDYYVGVPLCFLLSIFYWIFYLFLWKKRVTPKNVLFIELSEMGSAILVDPAMRKLQAGGVNLFFLIFEKNKPSLQLINTVEEKNIRTIREDSFFHLTLDTLTFFFWSYREGIDTIIDLELFSRFTALLTSFCAGKNRVGFYSFHNEGLYRGNFLTHRVAYNPHIHITKNFIALVNATLSDKKEIPFSKTLVEKSEMRLQQVQIPEEEKK